MNSSGDLSQVIRKPKSTQIEQHLNQVEVHQNIVMRRYSWKWWLSLILIFYCFFGVTLMVKPVQALELKKVGYVVRLEHLKSRYESFEYNVNAEMIVPSTDYLAETCGIPKDVAEKIRKAGIASIKSKMVAFRESYCTPGMLGTCLRIRNKRDCGLTVVIALALIAVGAAAGYYIGSDDSKVQKELDELKVIVEHQQEQIDFLLNENCTNKVALVAAEVSQRLEKLAEGHLTGFAYHANEKQRTATLDFLRKEVEKEIGRELDVREQFLLTVTMELSEFVLCECSDDAIKSTIKVVWAEKENLLEAWAEMDGDQIVGNMIYSEFGSNVGKRDTEGKCIQLNPVLWVC